MELALRDQRGEGDAGLESARAAPAPLSGGPCQLLPRPEGGRAGGREAASAEQQTATSGAALGEQQAEDKQITPCKLYLQL